MGWWKTADKGDLIVCVVELPYPHDGSDPVLKGGVYRIREMYVVPDGYMDEGEVGVRLAGHNNGMTPFGDESGWSVKHFRPVKPLHTSLTDCLNAPVHPWGVPTKERA